MLSTRPTVDAGTLSDATGWDLKERGLCKGPQCIPLPPETPVGRIGLDLLAERLNAALVHDETHGLWALGPETTGRALTTAELPDLELETIDARPFPLRSLRGRKALLVAWASW